MTRALDDVRARLAGAMAMLTQKQSQEFDARHELERLVRLDDDDDQCEREPAERAVDFAVLARQQAAAEVTDLLADALAEFSATIDTMRADMDKDRHERAAMAAQTAKWRSAMDRKLAAIGGSTMTGAGIATVHDHNGD
jgi:hypothetical protein